MARGRTQYKRILAVSTTALGDTLLSTPALRAIRHSFPRARLDLLVHRRSQDLLKNNPNFDRIFFYRNNPLARAGLTASMALNKYDKVFILHANKNVKKLLKHLRYGLAHNVQEWDDEGLRLESIPVGYDVHTIGRRLAMVEKAGGTIETGPEMDFILDDFDQRAADNWLEQRGIDKDQPLACLHPGAADPYKEWPAERFGEVARFLADKHGFRIIVSGVGRERCIFEIVRRESGQEIDFAKDLSLGTLAALIGKLGDAGIRVSLFVEPDPAHLVGDFDETRIHNYIRHALDVSRNCVIEMILKDTHTCQNRPERFDRWTAIARELAESY